MSCGSDTVNGQYGSRRATAVYRELQWCIWMQFLIDFHQIFVHIYEKKFPKIWHFLTTRGKNFGGAFFDVFCNLELNSVKISSIHSLPAQITDLWALVVHDCMRNCIFIPRLRTGIRKISLQHGQITKGASKRLSDTNPSEIGPRVSTSLPTTNFHAFSIPFRNSDGPAPFPLFSLLIQRSSLRRINNVLSSVV